MCRGGPARCISTTVPQAVQALARELRAITQSPWQATDHLPKHSPQDLHFGRVADQLEEQEDGRQFMETCAAEHSFRDLLT